MSIYYNHLHNKTQPHEREDIDHQRHKSDRPKQHQAQRQKNKIKPLRVKDKLSFIVNLLERQQSVAEISQYNQIDENDELDHSSSTVQSNHRQKYNKTNKIQFQKHKNNKAKTGPILGKEFEKNNEKSLFIKSKQRNNEQNHKAKYLFYNVIRQEKEDFKEQNKREQQFPLFQRKKVKKPIKQQFKAAQYEPAHDYPYQKEVHIKDEDKKVRMKNKIGFICDLFHRNQQVASVSYYSQSSKQSVETIHPAKQQSPIQQFDNIFQQNQFEIQQEPSFKKQQTLKNSSKNKSPPKSQQFQDISIHGKPIKEQHKFVANKQMEQHDTIFSKVKKSISVNRSLEKVELEMNLINRNRSKSKLSATKSMENKPKNARYNSNQKEEFQQLHQKPQKKSVQISRYIKDKSNKPSVDVSRQDKISKSRSQDSKFSIRLIEVNAKEKSQEQLNVEPNSPVQVRQKSEQMINEEPTVKKSFPISRNISEPKNNLSKYMKINFRQQEQSQQNDIIQEIPNILTKNTAHNNRVIFKQQPNLSKTNAADDKMPKFRPLNKIEFNLEKSKKKLTTQLPRKDDNELTEQQRKFITLLKKRQEALMKRVKEQILNNNSSLILMDHLDNGDTNQTFEQERQGNQRQGKNYIHAERRDKLSLKTEQSQIKPFPILNQHPSKQKEENFQTFYNNPLKKNLTKNLSYLSKRKKGYSEHLSTQSQKGRTLEDKLQDLRGFKREPSKISYFNIKKIQLTQGLKDKNNSLNSKQKIQRLRQLLKQ